MSVVSSIIGSGIVAIPYAMRLTQSLPGFIVMNAVAVFILLLSSKMLLMIRSNIKQLFQKESEVKVIECSPVSFDDDYVAT